MSAAPAADRLDAALAAAGTVARDHGCTDDLEVLHRSNNMVARCGELVFKVSAHVALAQRDVIVAAHAASRGGPAMAPVGELVHEQGFAVSVWPYCRSAPPPNDADREAAVALAAPHRALLGVPIALPALAERFSATAELLEDERATSALGDRDRGVLMRAVQLMSSEARGSSVLHAEPHDGNRLRRDGSTVYIDFEAVCIGPIEWDLAYLPDDLAVAVWPGHDARLRSALQLGVSTCVAVACWRHSSARPGDAEMRWHANHHLSLVRQRLDQ